MKNNQQLSEQFWKLLVLVLRKVAESKQISPQEIANRTGMLQLNINRFFQLKYCPKLDTFILIANAIGINFYFEDKDSTTELNEIFEAAMTELGRRPDKLPKN
jgi:DNA-binding phage protein